MAIHLEAIDKSSKVEVTPEVFDRPYNEGLVHQTVVAYLANARKWTAKKKNRSAVRGGGAKPWRQKGTGRARAGTIRSPLWKGGGKTFAPEEISYSHKINKKMYRAGVQSILSELLRQGTVKVFGEIKLEKPKTKSFVSQLSGWKLDGRTLMVFDEVQENVYLASRNLRDIDIVDHTMVNPYQLLTYDNVLIQGSAVAKIEERLK